MMGNYVRKSIMQMAPHMDCISIGIRAAINGRNAIMKMARSMVYMKVGIGLARNMRCAIM